jgi:UDP-N-acetylglucosamine 2-epimerase (non-hydrolysing)
MLEPIGLIFGTRPEYLKFKVLIHELERNNLEFRILQVNQHIDLDIEEKNHKWYHKIELNKSSELSRLNELANQLPLSLEKYIQECNSVIVQGDTATAFFGALTAFHLKKKIFHLEAGLRTYDLENPYPEEAYRSMISRIADVHFCPDTLSQQNLVHEKITKNTFVVGNSILDLVKSYKKRNSIGKIVPITVHRRENWQTMPEIVSTIWQLAKKRKDLQFIWIYHPNPSLQTDIQKRIQELGQLENLIFQEPCSHEEVCSYLHEAYCVITDSGGIQEEASFLGKYCFVLRKQTERVAIPEEYLELIKNIPSLELAFNAKDIKTLPPCTVYGDGTTCLQIISYLNN